MNILEKIVEQKRKEVAERKIQFPVKRIEKDVYFSRETFSMKEHLLRKDLSGIIAEIKRKSPSKGIINARVSIEQISNGYVKSGASALSILTDTHFFGGSNDDLMTARKINTCPILRKEFILEEYQIIEAKSIGADAILLIAAIHSPKNLKELCSFAHTLGLEVLLEVHDKEETIASLEVGADMIGINNRNLKTFDLSVETSKRLSELIPATIVKVSESGIESPEVIIDLKKFGFRGFLMGQAFMQTAHPEHTAMDFITELRRLERNATL
jgi:indole-3-glycerol phosphate synthase